MNRDKAKQIVNAIFSELGGRGGIGDQLDMISGDSDVYKEMHDTCVERVMKADAGDIGKFDHHWNPEGEAE